MRMPLWWMRMTLQPGDDVLVDFEGNEWRGEVVRVDHGWVIATIETDPLWDYGSITPRMAPHQTVAVKTSHVRPRD